MHEFTREALKTELHNIGNWWAANSCDSLHGGFYGEIDFKGQPVNDASKGIILNSRILWFFSELALFSPTPAYRNTADRAYEYLLNNFDDKEYEGAVWELAYNGSLLNGKKQTYAQCFCIYAYCAYYKLSGNKQALEKAVEYFKLIESHARDYELGGYIDALSQEWTAIDDFRLSDKDLNMPKTMNTHLHVLEAYTALHRVAPNKSTEEALGHVIKIFTKHIIDHDKGHLKLFFDSQWNNKSESYSFGHDIEASWLLWEAAEVLGDKSISVPLRPVVIKLADTCLHEGIGNMGQLCDDFDFTTNSRTTDSIWWVQTEALIGFLTAYKLTGKSNYRNAAEKLWYFIRQHHIDSEAGEWHWLAADQHYENKDYYKVGFWKAPYHNGRAMMEAYKLLGNFS